MGAEEVDAPESEDEKNEEDSLLEANTVVDNNEKVTIGTVKQDQVVANVRIEREGLTNARKPLHFETIDGGIKHFSCKSIDYSRHCSSALDICFRHVLVLERWLRKAA